MSKLQLRLKMLVLPSCSCNVKVFKVFHPELGQKEEQRERMKTYSSCVALFNAMRIPAKNPGMEGMVRPVARL